MRSCRSAVLSTATITPFWTGRMPVYGQCPGMRADGTISALPQIGLGAGRDEIHDYFDNGWAMTEVLFSALKDDAAYYRQPYHKLRHPMIFYYGHPVVLYVNKLRVAGLLDKPVNEAFEALFETGVDEMRWDDLHEGKQDVWPDVEEVRAYRREVYGIISNIIRTHPLLADGHTPITQESPIWALFMGFEHERIHLETSSVLIRELPVECLRRPSQWPASDMPEIARNADNTMITLPAGGVRLGKPLAGHGFGWDNEYGSETRVVRPFSASAQLISNAEFLVFVKAGGYTQERFWSREGWGWRKFRNTKAPAFWVQDGPAGLHQYKLRTLFEVVPMQPDWPVCVNFHEAKAYCVWRSEQGGSAMPYRLLTETEHHAIRGDGVEQGDNLALRSGSEQSVTASPANAKGFHDVFGNVWQWCEDHFHPLTGFSSHPYYDDFSTPCYDGEHQMILGGSFISAGDEASVFARFHFRPHFYQHAGFRIARSEDGNPASDAKQIHKNGASAYESKEMLHKYMLMHWGSDADIYDTSLSGVAFPAVAHLPLKCAELVVKHAEHLGSVLDLGCAVGRSSFELARHFQSVTGIDFSREFIDAAQALQHSGAMEYIRKDQGMQTTKLTAKVADGIDRSRVRFEQGDACTLPLHLKRFDAVLLANVLCRLPDPAACLERMQGANALVKKGGLLVMTTPFSWLAEYTPKERWLNGLEDVARVLSEFELLHQEELAFLIREHRRKFEYIITRASVWRRKG